MNIIHLRKTQRRCAKFEHPLLPNLPKFTREDALPLLNAIADGNPDARDELILGLRYVVKVVVGRFLHHWPVSHRFEEDMVSEGFKAVIEKVDYVDQLEDIDDFLPSVWSHVKQSIETMLNDSRSAFAPCWATNFNRVRAGLESEYNFATQLREAVDDECWDHGQEWADMLDELEYLKCEDSEHVRFLILRHLGDTHGLDEDDLTDEEREAVDAMSKIFSNL
jgi:hypothetical protein